MVILKMTVHHDQLIVPSQITGFAEGNTFFDHKNSNWSSITKKHTILFFFFNSKLYLHLIHSEEKKNTKQPRWSALAVAAHISHISFRSCATAAIGASAKRRKRLE